MARESVLEHLQYGRRARPILDDDHLELVVFGGEDRLEAALERDRIAARRHDHADRAVRGRRPVAGPGIARKARRRERRRKGKAPLSKHVTQFRLELTAKLVRELVSRHQAHGVDWERGCSERIAAEARHGQQRAI
jgi:hypothetical protein